MPSRAYISFLHRDGFPEKLTDYYVSMPSRAYISFLRTHVWRRVPEIIQGVNALSGLYLISTGENINYEDVKNGVNALSGLYLISTGYRAVSSCREIWCVNALSGLYLISTRQKRLSVSTLKSVNALSGLYLIST